LRVVSLRQVASVDIDTGRVMNGMVFAKGFAPGVTDGMRCDVDGNVWCSSGWADPREDGVRCYSPQGELLGKIHVPETVANLTFGGLLRNRLYVLKCFCHQSEYDPQHGAVVVSGPAPHTWPRCPSRLSLER
jgi:gluconolactonase